MFSITILKHKNVKYETSCNPTKTSDNQNTVWTFQEFIKQKTLIDESNGFIVNGKLTFICEITIDKSETNNKQSREVENNIMPNTGCYSCECFKMHLNNQKFSDVELLIDGKIIHAHKLLLSSKSEVFAAMFEHEMTENTENKVKIQDLSYEVSFEMLKYMYTGRIENLEKFGLDLLAAAEKYALYELKKKCQEQLCKKMDISNALECLQFGDKFKANCLTARAVQVIGSNFQQIVKTQKFKNFNQLNPDLITYTLQKMSNSNVKLLKNSKKDY